MNGGKVKIMYYAIRYISQRTDTGGNDRDAIGSVVVGHGECSVTQSGDGRVEGVGVGRIHRVGTQRKLCSVRVNLPCEHDGLVLARTDVLLHGYEQSAGLIQRRHLIHVSRPLHGVHHRALVGGCHVQKLQRGCPRTSLHKRDYEIRIANGINVQVVGAGRRDLCGVCVYRGACPRPQQTTVSERDRGPGEEAYGCIRVEVERAEDVARALQSHTNHTTDNRLAQRKERKQENTLQAISSNTYIFVRIIKFNNQGKQNHNADTWKCNNAPEAYALPQRWLLRAEGRWQ
jgi:hypothetical protein